jgi:hypothetical protein
VADIWAVCDVWARPEEIVALEADARSAMLRATNLWKFGAEQQQPIVRETVEIIAHPVTAGVERGRVIDLHVTLVALEDDVAIGGRPGAGYGGMTYRALPGSNQEIVPFVGDVTGALPAAWCRYTADFPNSRLRTSFVLFQHADNPLYPSQHNVYPNLNCFMPAFPGDSEYRLIKGAPVSLRHRMWITEGVPDQRAIETVWREFHK